MAITVVMPSRGRPERARKAVQAIRDTAVLVDTTIILAVDADDPDLRAYRWLRWPGHAAEVATVVLQPEESGNLVRATNTVALRVAEDREAIIGNLGDDHMARTPGWDRLVTEALQAPGIAYGRDGIHDEKLPTAPFISARIIRALGWYFLPTCLHLYCDDAVREIGIGTKTLRYLPDVEFEHMHPAVDKADTDEGYERANNKRVVDHDHRAYLAWRNGPYFHADIRNVQRALKRVAA